MKLDRALLGDLHALLGAVIDEIDDQMEEPARHQLEGERPSALNDQQYMYSDELGQCPERMRAKLHFPKHTQLSGRELVHIDELGFLLTSTHSDPRTKALVAVGDIPGSFTLNEALWEVYDLGDGDCEPTVLHYKGVN